MTAVWPRTLTRNFVSFFLFYPTFVGADHVSAYASCSAFHQGTDSTESPNGESSRCAMSRPPLDTACSS